MQDGLVMVQRNQNHKTCRHSIPSVRHSQPWCGASFQRGDARRRGPGRGPGRRLLQATLSGLEGKQASKGLFSGLSHFLDRLSGRPPLPVGFTAGSCFAALKAAVVHLPLPGILATRLGAGTDRGPASRLCPGSVRSLSLDLPTPWLRGRRREEPRSYTAWFIDSLFCKHSASR